MKEPFWPFVVTMLSAILMVRCLPYVATQAVTGLVTGFFILMIGWDISQNDNPVIALNFIADPTDGCRLSQKEVLGLLKAGLSGEPMRAAFQVKILYRSQMVFTVRESETREICGKLRITWCAVQGSNLRPLPCQGRAFHSSVHRKAFTL